MLKREMNIADYDAELWQAMEQEKVRQEEHIELIASDGALIIDVTAAIFICLYGYTFSGIVFILCYRFFSRKVVLHAPVYIRTET